MESEPSASSGKGAGRMYAAVLFLSSFLLFAVQPIVGKFLLPYFGGTPAVWSVSLFFYMFLLLAGYAYAAFVARKGRAGLAAHAGVLAVALLALTAAFIAWKAPLSPPLGGIMGASVDPVLKVLFALALSTGLPYLLLSTTSTIVQYWAGLGGAGARAYRLYALSNAASFLALLSYPFLTERLLSLKSQMLLWSVAYAAYAALMLFLVLRVRKGAARQASAEAGGFVSVGKRDALAWTLFALLPSYLLVATTAEITQSIAPVPFLWILPLSLYLLSYIVSFSGRQAHWGFATFLLVLSLLAYPIALLPDATVAQTVPLFSAILFLAGIVFHGELYRRRPGVASLPTFYLYASLGSALGGALASIAPPLVFNALWEYPIGLIVTAAVALKLSSRRLRELLRPSQFQLARGLIVALACYYGLSTVINAYDPSLFNRSPGLTLIEQSRNFFGYQSVVHSEKDDGSGSVSKATLYLHGSIIHGSQFDYPRDKEPTLYFVPESGVGTAMRYSIARNPEGLRAGIVGLGVGTLAAYCRPGDHYRFYEINPDVTRVAYERFTFLGQCPSVEVIEGDGRLSLEREVAQGDEKYDILVIDAFSDDAIPVHLITRESFGLYLDRLAENGVLVMQISNLHIDLAPVLKAISKEYGIPMGVITRVENGTLVSSSRWAVFSRDPGFFADDTVATKLDQAPIKDVRVWTDDYSNILSVLMRSDLNFRLSAFDR